MIKVGLRRLPIRFLDKAAQCIGTITGTQWRTTLNVAVPRFRTIRCNTESYGKSLFGQFDCPRHRCPEHTPLKNDVIRRHDDQDRILAFTSRPKCSQRHGRRRIAPTGFQQNLTVHPEQAKLLGNRKTVLFIAYQKRLCHTGKPVEPGHGLLQHGIVANQRQQLLGIFFARQRPKTGSRTTGQNNRDHDRHILVFTGFYPGANEDSPTVPVNQLLSRNTPLSDTARNLKVDEIVVAVSERRGGSMPLRELLDCKLQGVRVLDLASHFEQTLGQIRLDSLYAGWLIFGDGFRQGFVRTSVKRIFDIVCASILIILSLPVMAVAALFIMAEDGFPLLYRQERVGLNGRLFNVVKFRSMRRDAEKDGKPIWAQAKDNRVTRTGQIIRKLRVDELPQLFSVLKGDMSLVGPRPERPFFVDQLTKEIPFYAVRHSVKPGVTGWAQVRYHYGSTVEDSAEKLQYDLYYVKNHSLLLDIVILFETIGVVLTGKGAQ